MAKKKGDPKEFLLNRTMNRFQLNYARSVGATSKSIRECSPHSIGEWRDYYFSQVRPREHIEALGKKLYLKLTEVVQAELDSITEQDCIDYITRLVIDKTYDGYVRERRTIYEGLQDDLGVKLHPAPDDWDRGYMVDFYIQIGRYYIGIQIKPASRIGSPILFNEKEQERQRHEAFAKKHGAKVFVVFSGKVDDKKVILNPEVIPQIKAEIDRLKGLE